MKAKAIGAIVAAVLLVGWMAGTARADFGLYGNEQLTVNTSHYRGMLFGQSRARIVSNGFVTYLYATNSSVVDVLSDGEVWEVRATGSSAVHIFAHGVVTELRASDTSAVDIFSGAWVSYLWANNSSTVDVSGGWMNYIYAYDTSTITFDTRDFLLGGGLFLNGDTVLGKGVLTGKWLDGLPFTVNIVQHDAGATIRIVPEPASLLLLALGGLAVLRRRRRMA